MQREFVFKIKEKGVRKWFVAHAKIEVPENWDSMSNDDQREYLVKPTGNHMHPGKILYLSSRFQLATGVEEVVDFYFWQAQHG